MMNHKYQYLLVLCLIAFSSSFLFNFSLAVSQRTKHRTLKEIEQKSEYLRKKIEETKKKEKAEAQKLTKIQRELYSAQSKLRKNKNQLSATQNSLELTEEKLGELKTGYVDLQHNAKERIKQVYQGQRLKILEMLLKTPSLTDFLDVLYYQKLLVAKDKEILEKLSQQAFDIGKYKDRLAKEKIKIAGIVNSIERQKSVIAKQHSTQSSLVRKLRTERSSYEKAERELESDSQKLIAEINRLVGRGGVSGSGVFTYPLRGRLTSPFGMRRHPIFKVVSFHSGVDLAAPFGTPVKASDSGRVILSGWYGGYGKVVIVDHGMSYSTLYAHLNKTAISKGKNVIKGQIVGYEGQTGYSTGPHLHFEVRKSGKPQNPMKYLR